MGRAAERAGPGRTPCGLIGRNHTTPPHETYFITACPELLCRAWAGWNAVADAKHRPVQLTLPDWTGDLYRRIVKLADEYTTLENESRKLARSLPLTSLRRFPSLRRQKDTLER